jgi:hypothetical protein
LLFFMNLQKIQRESFCKPTHGGRVAFWSKC